MEVFENKEIVKKEIDDYFKRVILIINVFRYELLKNFDEKILVVDSLL